MVFPIVSIAVCLIPLCVCSLSQARLTLGDPMDCSWPVSLSMKISRQEYWSGLPFPTPGDLLDSRIEPMSLASLALAGRIFTTSDTGEFPNSIGLYLSNFSGWHNPIGNVKMQTSKTYLCGDFDLGS